MNSYTCILMLGTLHNPLQIIFVALHAAMLLNSFDFEQRWNIQIHAPNSLHLLLHACKIFTYINFPRRAVLQQIDFKHFHVIWCDKSSFISKAIPWLFLRIGHSRLPTTRSNLMDISEWINHFSNTKNNKISLKGKGKLELG